MQFLSVYLVAFFFSGYSHAAGKEFQTTDLKTKADEIELHMTTKQSFTTSCALQVEDIQIVRMLNTDDVSTPSPSIVAYTACDPNRAALAVVGPHTIALSLTRGTLLPKVMGTFEVAVKVRDGANTIDLDAGVLSVESKTVTWTVDGATHSNKP